MPKSALTQRFVETVACPDGRKDSLFFDGELTGFGLRVTASGSKVFLAQYSVAGGKRRVKIGAFGALTVKEARTRAKAVLGAAADGRDPFAEKQQAAVQLVQNRQAAEAQAVADAYTVRVLIDDWQKARADRRRPTYLTLAVAALKRHLGEWLDRPARSITQAEARDRIEQIGAGKPITGNRTLAYARAAFGWAQARGKLSANPFAGIERPGHERPRDRVLSRDEVGAIWRATKALTPPNDAFVRVLLLTLQRRDEVAAMRWAELDLDAAIWTLPAERAKNHKVHLVHLAEPVLKLLAGQPRINGSPFVFPAGGGKTPISAFSHTKRTLLAAIAAERHAERKRDAEEKQEAPDWRFHDFRRAGVTHLANMGFPPHIADKLLNHVTGAIQGVAAVYQRAEFAAERKAALDAWASFVLAAAETGQPDGNVIHFVRSG